MREAASLASKRVAASAQASDFAREAGASVTYNADGSWDAVVTGKENIRRAVEMQDGVRSLDIEASARRSAEMKAETLVDERGRALGVPEHLAERVAKKRGLKPKVYYGRPTERWAVRDGELVRVF